MVIFSSILRLNRLSPFKLTEHTESKEKNVEFFLVDIPAFDDDETRNETTFQATSNDIPTASRHIELENTDEHKFLFYKSRSSHVCFLTSSFCVWLEFMYQYTPLVRRILSFMWHLCMRLFMIYFLVPVVILVFAIIKYYNFANMSIAFSRRHSNKLTTPGNLKNYKFPFAIKVIINNKNEIKPRVETFIYAFTSSNVTKCLRKNVFSADKRYRETHQSLSEWELFIVKVFKKLFYSTIVLMSCDSEMNVPQKIVHFIAARDAT